MIDLHTHTLFSDGELLPSELVRRALVRGYEAIALTDHVDSSNVDFVLPRLVNVCSLLEKYWDITVLPGMEITHAPLEEIGRLIRYGRKNGACVIVVHGETVVEPVIPGTNRVAIEEGCDILAHPGKISRCDAILARKQGVALEITTRRGHNSTDLHVYKTARSAGADMVLDTDSHGPSDLVSVKEAQAFLASRGIPRSQYGYFNGISRVIVRRARHEVKRIKH